MLNLKNDERGLVWVVDDSKLELKRITGLLQDHYQVESFIEGGALLEQIAGSTTRPDLVLLDWQMPGISGLEACRFLRERFDEVSLPILMLTSRGLREDFTQGLSAGANDYVAKPYDDAELLARVRGLVRTRQHAERIREREVLFATTLRSIADGVITTDVDGQVTFLNRMAESLTRWTSAQALGKPFSDVFVANEPLGELDAVLPMMLHARDGAVLPIEGSGAPIGEGGALGRVVVFRDVTERRKAEVAAQERADFEQKLIGIVSHDLRSPLNVVSLSANLMLRRNKLEAQDARAASLVRSSGERALRMVSDLLDFTQARLSPGLPALRTQADIHLIGQQVLEEMQVTFPSRRFLRETSGDGGGSWDADRIVQLMTNLLSNALQYGAPDGEVVLRTLGIGHEVHVEVHNEGEPIAPALIPVLFQPMRRGRAAKTDRSIGLGLYIAQDIARSHGGSIAVKSNAKEGTTFSVRLPRGLQANDSRTERANQHHR